MCLLDKCSVANLLKYIFSRERKCLDFKCMGHCVAVSCYMTDASLVLLSFVLAVDRSFHP